MFTAFDGVAEEVHGILFAYIIESTRILLHVVKKYRPLDLIMHFYVERNACCVVGMFFRYFNNVDLKFPPSVGEIFAL